MMAYIIAPTDDNLSHSYKGTTWKNHKYTDIVTKNGKKYYKYGRYLLNRAAQKVNKHKGTNLGAKNTYAQYNPSNLTAAPNREIMFVPGGNRVTPQRDAKGRLIVDPVTGKVLKQYTPVKNTVRVGQAIYEGSTATNPSSKANGVDTEHMRSHVKAGSTLPVTNTNYVTSEAAEGGRIQSQYTPNNTRKHGTSTAVTNKNGTVYSPSNSTKSTKSEFGNYVPISGTSLSSDPDKKKKKK